MAEHSAPTAAARTNVPRGNNPPALVEPHWLDRACPPATAPTVGRARLWLAVRPLLVSLQQGVRGASAWTSSTPLSKCGLATHTAGEPRHARFSAGVSRRSRGEGLNPARAETTTNHNDNTP